MFRYIRALCSIAMVFAVTGCATSGLSGTTKLDSNYHNVVQADGAKDTTVSVKASGKAADVLEAVTNVTASSEDGTGAKEQMSFGANQKNDATQRGADIIAVNQVWAPIVQQLLQTIQELGAQAAPIVGQHIQAQAATAQASTAAKAATRQELINAIKEVLPQLIQQPGATISAPGAGLLTPSPAPVAPPAPATVAPRLPSTPPATPPTTSPEPDKPLNADGTVPADTIVPKPTN